VTGKPAAEGWKRVLAPVAERNLPFCVVLGNHDAEQDIPRAGIGRIVTSYAGTLNTLNADGELADVVLEIAGTKKPAALLYCLDSHDYSTIPSIDGYGWFTQEQVGWYRARSAAYTAANGGEPAAARSRLSMPSSSEHPPRKAVASARSAATENLKSFISKNLVCMFSINCSRIEQGPCPFGEGP